VRLNKPKNLRGIIELTIDCILSYVRRYCNKEIIIMKALLPLSRQTHDKLKQISLAPEGASHTK